LSSKGQCQCNWERKCESRFLLISSSKEDRFASNQDQQEAKLSLG